MEGLGADALARVLDPEGSAFCARVVAGCPGLRAVWAEHTGYWGEVITQLFVADLRRWAEAQALDPDGDVTTLVRLLAVLEDHVDGGGSAGNLVLASFIANMEPGDALQGWLGPRLAAAHFRWITVGWR